MVVAFPDIKAKQLADKAYIGKKVLLGIRPEHVKPNNKGELDVYVDVVEHLGDETIVYTKMEGRKDQFIIKTPFNSGLHANEQLKVDFDMNHAYLFDAVTHKAIMGIPHEDEIPVRITDNVIKIGEQEMVLEPEYMSHLLDNAFNNDIRLGIRPDYISLEEVPDSLLVKAKFEFVEQKTDYQAVYFSIKGVDGYRAIKVKNGEKVKLGEEVNLYLPYNRINMYDQEHNKLNSREVVYKNVGRADVGVDKKGNTVISIGCATLSYPDMGIKPGKYEIKFKQDKLMPLFPTKMIRKDTEYKLVNPVMENPKNVKLIQ